MKQNGKTEKGKQRTKKQATVKGKHGEKWLEKQNIFRTLIQ